MSAGVKARHFLFCVCRACVRPERRLCGNQAVGLLGIVCFLCKHESLNRITGDSRADSVVFAGRYARADQLRKKSSGNAVLFQSSVEWRARFTASVTF